MIVRGQGDVVLNSGNVIMVRYGSFGLCLGQNSNKMVIVFFSERRVWWEHRDAQKASSLAPKDDLNKL
jgi:hypothetical protein